MDNNIFRYILLDTKIPNSGTSVKAKPARIFAVDFAEEVEGMRMQIAEVLKCVKVEEILTTKEMSAIFGKHLSSWYRYMNAELVLPSNVIAVLIRVLAEKGHTELLSLMLPDGFTVVKLPETHGSIAQEFIEAVSEESLAVKYFEKNQLRKGITCAQRAETSLLSIVGTAKTFLTRGKK